MVLDLLTHRITQMNKYLGENLLLCSLELLFVCLFVCFEEHLGIQTCSNIFHIKKILSHIHFYLPLHLSPLFFLKKKILFIYF